MSVTIYDKTKSSPKWVPPPPKPIFRTTLEAQRYTEEKKRRWREGHGDGYAYLCGMHYFYLTEGTLKDGSDGGFIRPRYRDGDELIITTINDGFWNLTHNDGIIKRREIGLTSIGCGLLPTYSMRMFPNSTFGFTSCDKDRIYKGYADKTEPFLKELDIDIRPVFDKQVGWKSNETKNQVYQRLPWLVKGADGESTYNYSDFFAKETSSDDEAAKGFSSTRMRAGFYDEFPLHKRKAKLLNSSRSCFMKGTKQSGYLLWGGTVEEDITPEQINELQKLVSDSSILNFKITFVPGWWCLEEFMDENGMSDEKAGTEWILKEREKLDKLSDKSYVKAFIKNYPLSLEEIFKFGGGGRFEPDVTDLINRQGVNIITEKKPVSNYNISTLGGNTEARADKESPIRIYEHPREGIEYVFGIDGTSTSEESSGVEGSNIALVGMKRFDPAGGDYAPVVLYTERPKSLDQSYYIMANIIKHYNRHGLCKVMAESNAATAEHFGAFLIKQGLEKTIIYGTDLSGKGNVSKKKPFVYRTDDVKAWQYRQANPFLRKYIQNIWFEEIIADMKKKDDDNADVLDAFLMCLVALGPDYDKTTKAKVAPKRWVARYKYDNQLGWITEWEEV